MPGSRRRRRPPGAPILTQLGAYSIDWDPERQAGPIRGLERDCNPNPVNPSDQPPGDRREDNGNGDTN
ncbi:hypothetical protein NDU88_002268 [Pleurodeles waltl]|uniref:Uncharacterized protein n=1 Tax=Pleurodeles waltl TaxID=8319 RepID=A0AAV7P697_PLEWA|nr:hypothetical protein NDU88_002268 [Pleurodeles waltl]